MYIKGDTMIIEEVSLKNKPLSSKVTCIHSEVTCTAENN